MCAGMVTLSPTSVAPVCRVGDPLELTCSSSGSFSRWTIRVGNEQGVTHEEYRWNINSQDVSEQVSMIELNSTTFTFMRTSSQGSLPLVSMLVIDSVNRYLNGTEVHCLDVIIATTASTTIRLFDMGTFVVYMVLDLNIICPTISHLQSFWGYSMQSVNERYRWVIVILFLL